MAFSVKQIICVFPEIRPEHQSQQHHQPNQHLDIAVNAKIGRMNAVRVSIEGIRHHPHLHRHHPLLRHHRLLLPHHL